MKKNELETKGGIEPPSVTFRPLTPGNWDDFERLFGPRGACAGCWCMYFMQASKEFNDGKGEQNRLAMRRLVESGTEPGLIAYSQGETAGWCAVGPRERYTRISRSKVTKPVDDEEGVWSIVCFFVAKKHRRMGLSTALLNAAAEYAFSKGARIVEGYAVDPAKPDTPDIFAYTGLASAFQKAGFVEVARRSPTRPIMRKRL